MNRILENKVAIVTGASQGLGLEITKRYIEAGASVAICARNAQLLALAQAQIKPMLRPGQELIAQFADVSDARDVASVVATAMTHFGRIDILVNNAGVYGPMGAVEDVEWQEWVHAVEINLYGSILMCRAVLPHFRASGGNAKIIQLSGGGAAKPLPRFSAYAVSKAAIVRFVETLAEEVRESGIDVNAIAPGALNTQMLDEVLIAGPEKVGPAFYAKSLEQKETGGAPLEKAADLAVFLGSPLSDGLTGKLISAMWDPWPSLPMHLDDLKHSDIYTLRRIMPKDRGKAWGNDS